jgi:hypothetical protein
MHQEESGYNLRWLVPNDLTKRFIWAREVVGLNTVRPTRPVAFSATRLLAEGVPVRTVTGRLGDSNLATTLEVICTLRRGLGSGRRRPDGNDPASRDSSSRRKNQEPG